MTLNRSFLFAPGNVPRRVEKALTLEADAVIVDLEDSVAASDKAATRKAVAQALSQPRRGRGYVRVNAASTPFCYGDLVETIHKGVQGVVLPKVESAGEDRKSTRLNSSHLVISYAVFCLKKKKIKTNHSYNYKKKTKKY